MSYPYIPSDFLKNQSADEIHHRMMAMLPDGIDKSENQIPWDFTRHSAIEKSEFISFELNETIKLMFPQWAYNEWLDLHAQMEGLTRRPANPASGSLTVTGRAGMTVAQGFQFATQANLAPSVIFEAVEKVEFSGTPDLKGMVTVTIPVKAVEGGRNGNVPPDTIILMVRPDTGITYISNPESTSGGTSTETDDELRERIVEAKRLGSSYVGNNADYVRWAKEVSGVGQVIVIPEAHGPGTVELIIVDGNGIPANQQIIDAVYSHIMGTGATDIARLAPIGAALTVVAPSALEIDITGAVILSQGENIGEVTERFKANLIGYWSDVANEARINTMNIGYVRLVQVGAVLAKTLGVSDYINLTINGGTDNIAVTQKEFPITGEVILNV